MIYQSQTAYEKEHGLADVLYDDRAFEAGDLVLFGSNIVFFALNRQGSNITFLTVKDNFLKVLKTNLMGNGGSLFAAITYDNLLN